MVDMCRYKLGNVPTKFHRNILNLGENIAKSFRGLLFWLPLYRCQNALCSYFTVNRTLKTAAASDLNAFTMWQVCYLRELLTPEDAQWNKWQNWWRKYLCLSERSTVCLSKHLHKSKVGEYDGGTPHVAVLFRLSPTAIFISVSLYVYVCLCVMFVVFFAFVFLYGSCCSMKLIIDKIAHQEHSHFSSHAVNWFFSGGK